MTVSRTKPKSGSPLIRNVDLSGQVLVAFPSGTFRIEFSVNKDFMTSKTIQAIHQDALASARTAEAAFFSDFGETFYCGFAWVEVKVRSNSTLGKALQSIGFTKSYSSRGTLMLWNPAGSSSQSMDLKEAGAMAYARSLRADGIQAYSASRAD